VKEANSYAAPITVVVLACGLASQFMGGLANEMYFYLIPMLNSALSISAIFSYDVSIVNVLATVGSNLAFTLICVFVLTKIFNSEKIVFDK